MGVYVGGFRLSAGKRLSELGCDSRGSFKRMASFNSN